MSHWAEPGREADDAGARDECATVLRDLPSAVGHLAAATARWGAKDFLVERRASILEMNYRESLSSPEQLQFADLGCRYDGQRGPLVLRG